MRFFRGFWSGFKRGISKAGSFALLALIVFYKSLLSVISSSGGSCRFYPSCSEYAFLAYKNRSFFEASLLVFKRLKDCRPFGPKVRDEPSFNEEEGGLKIL